MNKLKEATKNFFVCGILMLIVGAALIALSKKIFGAFTLICGVVFLVIGIVFLLNDLREGDGK